jgi:hypothetical protein
MLLTIAKQQARASIIEFLDAMDAVAEDLSIPPGELVTHPCQHRCRATTRFSLCWAIDNVGRW